MEIDLEDCYITTLKLSKNSGFLLAGTSKGSIRVYLWPLVLKKSPTGWGDESLPPEFMEYFVHQGPVTKLALSADNNYLMSSSLDGTVISLRMKEILNGID